MPFDFRSYVHPAKSLLLVVMLILGNTYSAVGQGNGNENRLSDAESKKLIADAAELRRTSSESAERLLNKYYHEFLESGDTLNAIESLFELSKIFGHKAEYKRSYDELWKCLLLVDDLNEDLIKAKLYRSLGHYYSYYGRTEEALKYLGYSLKIQKESIDNGSINEGMLVQTYWAYVTTYRESDNQKKAQEYLDSCFLVFHPTESPLPIETLQLEKAFQLDQNELYSDAFDIYQEVTPWFEKNSPSYLVLVYSFIADNLWHLDRIAESENYFNKALAISKKHRSHIDFTPIIHKKLAELYESTSRYEEAYEHMVIAKELDAIFFDSRSENNRPLLEIQDAYRSEKERQKQIEQEQRIAQLEQEDSIIFLQRTLLIGALSFFLLTGFLYLKYIRTKHKTEKQILQAKQELEIKNTHQLLKLKNKELAANTIQMIERDETLASLKKKLKEAKDGLTKEEIRPILRSISINKEQNWEEFRARFVAVNQDFYKNLNDRFPNLSRSEQKLCALIKLKFSSKEISKLLGISNESVQTSRYRLRKKLKLEREYNLTDFISSI